MTTIPPAQITNKWLVWIAVTTGTFMSVLDGSIMNIAQKTLMDEFGVSFSMIQWVVLSYMLTVVSLMLVMGRLGDMFGKKWIYTIGYLLFTLSSIVCGFAVSIPMLIVSRIVQALGSVMMMSLGAAIVTEIFPPSERGQILGLSGLTVSLGGITGPTLGGLLLNTFGWRSIFFINVPIGIIGILLAIRFIPLIKPSGKQIFDFGGASALCIGLLSLLLGLNIGGNIGYANPLVLSLFGLFLVTLTFFIWLELRLEQPMLDLRIFRTGLFSINLITGLMTFMCSAGIVYLFPFFLQNVMKFNPGETGLMLTIVPITMGIIAPFSGRLSDKFGTRPLTVIGLSILFLGYLGVSNLTPEISKLEYALRLLPIGLGMGIFQSPNNSAIMGSAPRSRLGVASGLMSITRTMGQTVGTALMASIWSSRVSAIQGSILENSPTAADPAIQALALNQTLYISIVVIFLAVLLSLWAFQQERHKIAPVSKAA